MFIYKPSWQKSANCLLNWKNYFSTKWKLQTFIRQYHISSMYKLNQAKNNISLKFHLVSHSPYWSSRKEFRCYNNFVRFPSTLYRVWVSALWYMTLNIYWMKVIYSFIIGLEGFGSLSTGAHFWWNWITFVTTITFAFGRLGWGHTFDHQQAIKIYFTVAKIRGKNLDIDWKISTGKIQCEKIIHILGL